VFPPELTFSSEPKLTFTVAFVADALFFTVRVARFILHELTSMAVNSPLAVFASTVMPCPALKLTIFAKFTSPLAAPFVDINLFTVTPPAEYSGDTEESSISVSALVTPVIVALPALPWIVTSAACIVDASAVKDAIYAKYFICNT